MEIDKYLKKVDLIDYYITKNIIKIIKNKNEFDFIKSNIFLLSVTNKNDKNSLIILLDLKKFKIIRYLIDFDFKILSFKNFSENNLFTILLKYDYFYKYIENLISKLDINFIIKILTEKNNAGNNFIDNIIKLINYNFLTDDFINDPNYIYIIKLIKIIIKIYQLDNEKITLVITKLCKVILNQNYLLFILKKININNFDIYLDNNFLTCIDYLIIKEFFETFKFLIEKINYIEFINLDNNIIFKLMDNENVDNNYKIDILFNILRKSNISKLLNDKNQNIFYKLLEKYIIEPNILVTFFDIINIYEQDINGITLYDIIKIKYSSNDLIKIEYYIKKELKNIIKFNDEIYLKKLCNKINIKKKLIKCHNGIFNSDILHNMIYTLLTLKSNKKIISIPYHIQSIDYKNKQEELIKLSNNNRNILEYINQYFNNFNIWLPHFILWKNKNNYWIDPNLIEYLKLNKTIEFIYIKLSVYLLDNINTRHSNIIIIDNLNKIVERFEPYGELNISNSNDINNMIQKNISNILNYDFKFVQPYPGFQSRSDEFGKFNKSYGDPNGYCLAWSFLYLDIKLELRKNKSLIDPLNFINWYIINIFPDDFKIDKKVNKTNIYILFIRYYARNLDLNKNKLILKYKLDPSIIYQQKIDMEYRNKIILNINDELKKIYSVN